MAILGNYNTITIAGVTCTASNFTVSATRQLVESTAMNDTKVRFLATRARWSGSVTVHGDMASLSTIVAEIDDEDATVSMTVANSGGATNWVPPAAMSVWITGVTANYANDTVATVDITFEGSNVAFV
jgi:hypothetical protein